MKQILINIYILLIISCGSGKDKSNPTQNQPVYYLENYQNTFFNLNEKVKTISELYINRKTDSILKFVIGFNMRPLSEMIGFTRGHREFDSIGLIKQNFGYKDSLDFVNNTKATIGSLYFHKTDSFPTNIDYHANYSRNIIYPGMLKFTQAFETVSANIPNTEANINSDSIFYNTYSYIINHGKIKYRLKQKIFPDGKLVPYYEERVEYIYDSLNRIVRENYSYYEILDDWFPPTRVSHEYHNIKVGSRDIMHKTYAYDEENQVVQVMMYINDNYVFEEKYTYGENGNLVSKIRIDPRWRAHLGNRSYRTLYHYDQYGNIIQVDMQNKDGELEEQLWVDYYDFDKHNNWQRCEMFLNNTHDGEPTLTGYRRITYYE